MSGPKIDSVSIEQTRAMQLAAERSRNESMLHDALIKLDKKICSLKADCLGLNNHRDEVMSEIENLERILRTSMIQVATYGYPSEVEEAREFNDQVDKELLKMVAEIKEKSSPITERIKSAISSQRETARLESFANHLWDGEIREYGYLSDDLITVLIAKASGIAVEDSSLSNDSLKRHLFEDAESIMSRIRWAIASDSTDAARKTTLTNLAKRINEALVELDTAKKDVLDVRQLLDGITPILNEINTHDEVMKDLYADCIIQQSIIFGVNGRAVELSPLWEFKEECELEDKLSELKELSRKYIEDSYIAYSLDKVMAKHGYTIAKAVSLSEGKQEGHRIFMSEHDDVGIHVYLASNGVLAMEVASIDDGIRTLEEGQVVEKHVADSSYDRIRLLEEQINFCDLHPAIITDLSNYGVSVTTVKDKEPSEDNSVLFEAVATKRQDADQIMQRRKSKRSQSELRERMTK